jgi:hypothetical protein
LGGGCWAIGVVMRSIGMGRGGRGNEVDETGIEIGIDQWGLKKVSCILSILFLDYDRNRWPKHTSHCSRYVRLLDDTAEVLAPPMTALSKCKRRQHLRLPLQHADRVESDMATFRSKGNLFRWQVRA